MRVFTTLFSLLLLSLLLYPLMAQAEAQPQPLLLFLDGKQLTAEVAPQINKDGKTIVPVRIIAQSLGSKVQWEEKSRKVTLVKADVSIQMFIDKKNAIVNDKTVMLETAPSIIDGNTMLPVRFISEQFGIEVTWDEPTQSVFLFKQESDTKAAAKPPTTTPAPAVDGKVVIADPPVDKGKVDEGLKPTVKPPAGQTSEALTTVPVDSSKDKPAVKPPVAVDSLGSKSLESPQTKPNDKSTASPEASGSKPVDAGGKSTDATKEKPPVAPVPSTEATTSGLKPITTFANNPPGYEASLEVGGKKVDSLTTIQSISIENEQLIVHINGAKVTPNVTISKNPNRIQIDIPNAKLDTALKLNQSGEGTVAGKSNSISQIRYLLFSKESSIVRIIIDLTRKVDFKPSTAANSTTQLAWSLLPAKERYTVVIDPGHGGKDTGAISVTNRMEKDFVLAMGTKVFNLLAKEPKIEVVVTRKNDTFIELPGRAAIANDIKADLFVSIHGNAATKEDIEGVETYYYSEDSLPFAKLMHEKVLKSSGFADRKVKHNDFHVIKNTSMPSILLELGFLSNRVEEETMFKDAFQNQVAASIVAGIKQQLNID